MKRSYRREIARDTLKILEQGYYINSKGEEVSIALDQERAENQTRLYTPDKLIHLIKKQPIQTDELFDTVYEVNPLTTLDAVRAEIEQDEHMVCLNFASARNAGGGFLNGSQAQEESIARASGLYNCQLKAEHYYKENRQITTCLYTDHIIYSPNVPIFKTEDGKLMDQAINCSIITAPAVNAGAVSRNEPQNIAQIEPRMARRIEMVLAICSHQKHQTLVLGAWGCGVFRNDPEVVAQMFYDQLTGKYKGQFKRVIFAIYAKDQRFISPFQDKFGTV